MGKPALGKGMRDLIAKNFGVETREPPAPDRKKALEELEILISRYRAQGYDVSYLESLKELNISDISSGLDAFRMSIKVLAGAQTQLRSLEGYGYTKEIEAITADIRDPLKAEEVLLKVEELKDRALTEHNIKLERKDTAKVKLPESLKLASMKLKTDRACSTDQEQVLDQKCLDSLLDNLDSLSNVFSVQDDVDPLMVKIADWETKGYFVDRLKTAYSEGREVADVEIARFEEDLKELVLLKERYRSLDLTGYEKERKELEIRFQYPHLWFEIKNELDRLSSLLSQSAEKEQEVVAVPPAIEASAPVEEKVEPTTQPLPSVPSPPKGTVAEEAPKPPEAPPAPPPEVKSPPAPALDDKATPDELLEKAKEAYSQDRLDEALTLFKHVLAKDPENSKAKFMIKRLSSKMG
ncbi:MAG: hypothetical protein MUC62_10405 [Candidatus Thermoplasmatota archaeon]|jgi:tetratricopeptide (TPR) repeat protein|nr:hypothetical protein [Candidatus Thermoplasmatota archaeon]